jgi:membrane protease YdiL (CAAX protease family)
MNVFQAPDGRLRAGWRAACGLLVFVLAEIIAAGTAGLAGNRPIVVEAFSRTVDLAILLAGFVLLLIAVDGVDDRPLAAMGLGWKPQAKRQIVGGIAFGGLLVGLCVAVILATSTVAIHTSFNARALLHAALAFYVLGVAAMAEETAFRGYPFQRLVEAIGPVAAVILAAVGFGLIHGYNPEVSRLAIANTVLFGVLLAVAYLRSGALWLPWGIHFGWNAALGLGFGLPLSGVKLFASVVRMNPVGPTWITGGGYGIEGGGLATAVIALAIPAVYWGAARVKAPTPADLPGTGNVTAL